MAEDWQRDLEICLEHRARHRSLILELTLPDFSIVKASICAISASRRGVSSAMRFSPSAPPNMPQRSETFACASGV